MGITEDRKQKQVHFCFVCNGPGTSKFDETRRVCPKHLPLIQPRTKSSLAFSKPSPYETGSNERARQNKITVKKPKRELIKTTDGRLMPTLSVPRPKTFRYITWHQQNGLCHYCKRLTDMRHWTVDHKHPKRLGGSVLHGDNFNLVGACYDCNHKKGDMTYEEFVKDIPTRWMHI